MTWLRLLNVQGIAGLAASICLALLLVVQKAETRHWKKQSAGFEQSYRAEQTAQAATIANYRDAAAQAQAADAANAQRVAAEQRSINERTRNAFETRIADARADAERLRSAAAAAHPGGGRSATVPGLSPPPGGVAEGSSEGRLPNSDALTATEQAIQLDELIKWIRKQHEVDSNQP